MIVVREFEMSQAASHNGRGDAVTLKISVVIRYGGETTGADTCVGSVRSRHRRRRDLFDDEG